MKRTIKICSVILSLLIILFCMFGCENITDEDITTGSNVGSIVLHNKNDENCQKLINDMRSGNVPKSCDVLYDQSGSRPSVLVEDKTTILELYNKFTKIIVAQQVDESVTDCYHHVIFTLQDNTKVPFYFEGDIWNSSDGMNYKVSDNGGFWSFVKELQDKEMKIENQ